MLIARRKHVGARRRSHPPAEKRGKADDEAPPGARGSQQSTRVSPTHAIAGRTLAHGMLLVLIAAALSAPLSKQEFLFQKNEKSGCDVVSQLAVLGQQVQCCDSCRDGMLLLNEFVGSRIGNRGGCPELSETAVCGTCVTPVWCLGLGKRISTWHHTCF